MKRDFRIAIASAQARLEQIQMPAFVATRVRTSLDRVQGRRRIGSTLFGLALATVASLVLARAHLQRRDLARLPSGFETISNSSDLRLVVDAEDGAVDVRTGTCTLRVQGWGSVTLRPGALLRRVDGGVELLFGEADFRVDKRAPGTGSTFVRGPQGTIEITGTRFSVIQRRDDGSVRLDEGGIRFHDRNGRTVVIVPGEALNWPLPAPALPLPPAPESSSVGRPARVEAPPARSLHAPSVAKDAGHGGVETMIERIAMLRAKGQYRELADELEVAMLREGRSINGERLSFELGSVLSYHLSDRTQACAHWAAHRRRFPSSTYAEEVADAERILHCSEGAERQ